MKVVTTIARILLGLMFLVFGLNGFLHFIPQKPPTGLALQFVMVLSESHFMVAVFLIQTVAGALLLANRFVPIALVLLGPLLVSILLYHILLAPAGLPPGAVATILWFIVFSSVRRAFAGVFAAKTEVI